jgi:hypothetical protein
MLLLRLQIIYVLEVCQKIMPLVIKHVMPLPTINTIHATASPILIILDTVEVLALALTGMTLLAGLLIPPHIW